MTETSVRRWLDALTRLGRLDRCVGRTIILAAIGQLEGVEDCVAKRGVLLDDVVALAPAAMALSTFATKVQVPRWMRATSPSSKPVSVKSLASHPLVEVSTGWS
jgi:hypothetical protein